MTDHSSDLIQDDPDIAEKQRELRGSGFALTQHTWFAHPPDAELSEDGRHINWWYGEKTRDAPKVYSGVLARFIEGIRTGSDIPKLVRKFGKLNLCELHQQPWTHNEPFVDRVNDVPLENLNVPSCRPDFAPEQGTEPVDVWLRYRDEFDAVLKLVAGVRDDSEGILEHEAWQTVPYFGYPIVPEPYGITIQFDQRDPLENARSILAHLVNHYLRIGGVRPSLVWPSHESKPVLGYEPSEMGLFGVLALQLATKAAGVIDTYECSGCHREYWRTGRRPKRNLRNWCQACKKDGTKDLIHQQERRQRIAKRIDGKKGG